MIDFTTITACGECCVGCKKKEDGPCEGCIETDGHCMEWAESGQCPIHKCAKEHGVQFCGLCSEFPCDELPKKIQWNPNVIEYLTELSCKYKNKPMFQDIKQRITEPEVGKIISYASFEGSTEGIAKEAEKYLSSDTLNFYGWVEDVEVVGICGYEVHGNKVEIHLISVAEDRQRKGVGGAMVTALQEMYGIPLEAETDDDAVEFYRKCGFITTVFQHPKKGKRHTCVLGVENSGHKN